MAHQYHQFLIASHPPPKTWTISTGAKKLHPCPRGPRWPPSRPSGLQQRLCQRREAISPELLRICCLMLVDVAWCWLMLVDVGWCCLMLVDIGWCWLMLLDVAWCWLMLVVSLVVSLVVVRFQKKSIWTMKDSVIRVEMVWAWVCKLCMVTWFLNSHAWNSSMVPEWPSTEPKLCANKAESHASVVVGRHLRSTKLAATSGFYLIVGSEDSQGENPLVIERHHFPSFLWWLVQYAIKCYKLHSSQLGSSSHVFLLEDEASNHIRANIQFSHHLCFYISLHHYFFHIPIHIWFQSAQPISSRVNITIIDTSLLNDIPSVWQMNINHIPSGNQTWQWTSPWIIIW